MVTKVIKPATKPNADYHDWDPIYPVVVESFLKEIDLNSVPFEVSHIGSTSIVGCGGKGVIDLLCEYESGSLDVSVNFLLMIGFNHQGKEFTRPWPKHRPMLLGTYNYNGIDYLLYIHVVEKNKDEVRRFKDFQRILREDPEKVKKYNECKMEIIRQGIRDTDEYAKQKSALMRDLMGDLHVVKP
jgi:GrpB-like predicted nucleotidyltransferase (UPF0157 family)